MAKAKKAAAKPAAKKSGKKGKGLELPTPPEGQGCCVLCSDGGTLYWRSVAIVMDERGALRQPGQAEPTPPPAATPVESQPEAEKPAAEPPPPDGQQATGT